MPSVRTPMLILGPILKWGFYVGIKVSNPGSDNNFLPNINNIRLRDILFEK